MPFCIWMRICKRVILVLRKLQEDQSLIHSWSRVFASRNHSHMPVSNNNQNHSRTQRLPFSTLSLSLRPKKIMLKLELITQMISKRLLMLNGILFTPNSRVSLTQELRLFSQVSQLVILPLNTSLIEISSALVESKKMIFKELLRQLVLSSRPPPMESTTTF